MFKLIVCTNLVGAIGKDNKLLYHIKNDMDNFKRFTDGNTVIMGMNTYLSLPNQKPLKNRTNIVLTSNPKLCTEKFGNTSVHFVNSINGAITLMRHLNIKNEDVFVIGGSSIYKAFLEENLISEAYITLVEDKTEGDSYFPLNIFSDSKWKNIYESLTQEENNIKFKFMIYKKK
jgi:Dihydrofolate reductase